MKDEVAKYICPVEYNVITVMVLMRILRRILSSDITMYIMLVHSEQRIAAPRLIPYSGQ